MKSLNSQATGWVLHPPGETGENRIINSGMLGDEPGSVVRSLPRRVQERESREESVTTAQGVEWRQGDSRGGQGGQVEVHGGGLDAELRGIASASQGTGHSVAKAGCGGSHPRLVGAEPVQSWPRGPSGLVGAIASARPSCPSFPHHPPSSFPFSSPPLLLLPSPPTLPFFPPIFLSFPS